MWAMPLATFRNDPTAEHDPVANWEIGAVATEELAKASWSAASSPE